MEGFILFGLFLIGLLIAAPIMASMALGRTRELRDEIGQLRTEVELLRRRQSDRDKPAPAPAKTIFAREPERVVPPEPKPELKPEPKPEPIVAKAPEPPVQVAPEPPPRPSTPPPAPVAEPVAAVDWAKTSASLERMIAANWLVWVGGAALALGGIFLVRYALEMGYFGPLPRTIAAVFAGFAMIAGSEWLRRRIPEDAVGQIGRAPLAVAAAGAMTLYGAAYAAGPLYHFLSPELTLAGFVAASAVAVALAVRHGVFLAALGLTGGYVAPLLVGGGTPEPVLLLAYAFAVTLACLVLVRAFNWERIVWIALIGAGAWMAIGVAMVGLGNGPIAVAGYGLALLLAANAFAWSDANVTLITHGDATELAAPPNQTLVMAMGFWVVVGAGLLLAMGIMRGGQQDPLTIALGVYGVAAIFAGWRKPAFEIVPLFGAAAFIGGLWLLPLDAAAYRFQVFAWIGAAATGLGGWYAMRRQRYPAVMATVSAFAPLILLITAFHRLGQDQQHFSWGLAAGIIAMLNVLVLEGMRRSTRGLDGAKGAASAYALAAFAGSMFAVGASLGQMWMTMLFAAHLPAIAMIDRRFNLDALKLCASIAAIMVMARLLMPGEILSYPVSTMPVLNELTVLYGVSLLCFWGAARLFVGNLKSAEAPLVQALDVGAITLLTVLVGLLVRHAATGGDMRAGSADLVEISAYTVSFAGLALGLAARLGKRPQLWATVAAMGVHALAALLAVIGLGLAANPLFDILPQKYLLDGPPLINLLAASYLPPAALFGLHAMLAQRQGRVMAVQASGVIALALTMLYLVLEVRNIFHVDLSLQDGSAGLAEISAYTVMFTATALGLLIWSGTRAQPGVMQPVISGGANAVYAVALGFGVVGLGLVANPLFDMTTQRYPLNGPPLLNLLASSYLPAAALFGVHAMLARRMGRVGAGQVAGFIAFALVFLYLSLEVRNAFHLDLALRAEPTSEAESYAYSITWLLFAVAILIVGMARRSVAIRHAAMAVLALSVAKVFVLDMASLTGVLRAVSFMGLGVALIGIAYLYQRVVFRREAS